MGGKLPRRCVFWVGFTCKKQTWDLPKHAGMWFCFHSLGIRMHNRVICQFCQRMQACDSFSILWECRCISLWFVICDKIQRQLYFLPFAYPKCRSSTTIFMWWEEVFMSSTMTTTMNLKRKNESRRIKWSREGERTEEEETNEKRK